MKRRNRWQDFAFSTTILAVAFTILYSTYSFKSDQTKTVISRQYLKGPDESLFESIHYDRVVVALQQNEPQIQRVVARQAKPQVQTVASEEKDFWEKLEEFPVLVASDRADPEHPGATERIKIVKTNFEYPLIRVVETFERPNQATANRRIAMVADHVLISLKPGYTQRDLEAITEKYGVKIRKKLEGKLQTYLVSFEYRDTESLDRIVEDFQREGKAFMVVQPDYIQNL